MNREDRLSSFSLSLGLLLLLRVLLHCCHVRLPRPRPGHSLRRGEHLGLVGPAKLEADLAGADDGDISHGVMHERELPVVRG
jgi:hypothetical protein